MQYREFAPSPQLRRWVRCYWSLKGDGVSASLEPILPDGSFEFVFHLGERFVQLEEECLKTQPLALLISELHRPVSIAPTGPFQVFGIRLHPGGAYPFVREPMREVVNVVGPLDAVWENLREDLGSLRHDRDRVALVDRRLRPSRTDDAFDRLAEWMRRSRGAVRVDTLARLAGLSSRQVQRRFHQRLGVGPKSFARVLRFRHVVRSIRSSPQNWLDAAMAAGFYDQAHLINEFRSFSGMTPGEFAARTLPMDALFNSVNLSMNMPVSRARVG